MVMLGSRLKAFRAARASFRILCKNSFSSGPRIAISRRTLIPFKMKLHCRLATLPTTFKVTMRNTTTTKILLHVLSGLLKYLPIMVHLLSQMCEFCQMFTYKILRLRKSFSVVLEFSPLLARHLDYFFPTLHHCVT